MEINVTFRTLHNCKECHVSLPISLSRLKQKFGLDDSQELQYIITDSTCSVVKEYDTLENLNTFSQLVERCDDKIVYALHEVYNWMVKEFVSSDFSFDKAFLLTDVTNEKELGKYILRDYKLDDSIKDSMEMSGFYAYLGRDVESQSEGGFSSYGFVFPR